jgi:uncharacterized protein YuzE
MRVRYDQSADALYLRLDESAVYLTVKPWVEVQDYSLVEAGR